MGSWELLFGLFVQLSILANLKSFGVSYLSPYAPQDIKRKSFTYFLHHIWKDENRPDFLATKQKMQEPHISLKWKYSKGK